MIWVILATVFANMVYKAREYGRADIADLIIFVAALGILFLWDTFDPKNLTVKARNARITAKGAGLI